MSEKQTCPPEEQALLTARDIFAAVNHAIAARDDVRRPEFAASAIVKVADGLAHIFRTREATLTAERDAAIARIERIEMDRSAIAEARYKLAIQLGEMQKERDAATRERDKLQADIRRVNTWRERDRWHLTHKSDLPDNREGGE